jgi:hypothetical protein
MEFFTNTQAEDNKNATVPTKVYLPRNVSIHKSKKLLGTGIDANALELYTVIENAIEEGFLSIPGIVGTGDMAKAVYDPNLIEGDAFDMANMVESATAKILTDTERSTIISNSLKLDSVVAGTNVTIDDTDPLNPIISSTGGGGATTLQDAFDNSSIPQITTDGSLTTLFIKQGSGSDSNIALQILNGTNNTVFSVDGEGDIITDGNISVGGTIDGVDLSTKSTDWDSAYGWGDHSLAGYIDSPVFEDNVFQIIDDLDNTKIATFGANLISTGTTRSYLLPDQSGTLALTSDLSGSTSTLQDSYDASTSPQILTSTINGPLNLKRGSADDTDAVLLITKGNGDPVAGITGAGQGMFYDLQVVYDIVISGKVDGRFVNADGTTLDNHVADTSIHFSDLSGFDTDDLSEGTTNVYNKIPTGGIAGQVIEKVDGTDYNIQWATPSTGGADVNVETLSADKNIAEGDPAYQLLDPAGNKTVALPLNPATGTFFFIKNDDSYSASTVMFIQDYPGGHTIDRLYPGSSNGYVWDGAYWNGTKHNLDYARQSLEETNLSIGYAARGTNYSIGIGRSVSALTQSVGVGHSINANTNATAVGNYAYALSTSTALGYYSRATYNTTSVGAYAGASNNGSNNVFVGYRAGDNLTLGNNNIIVGYDIDTPSTTSSNTLIIGNLLYSDGIDGTGTTVSTGGLGVGTSTPNQRLTIEGTMDLAEQASAGTDTAGYGQIWVKNDSPNTLWFTDDTGTDVQLGTGGGSSVPSVNLETLSANKTLVEGDAEFQLLDPGLGNRDIILPASPTVGTTFTIVPLQDYNSGARMYIKNSSGQAMDYLGAGRQALTVIWDGTYWIPLQHGIDFSRKSLAEASTAYGFEAVSYAYGTAFGAESAAQSQGVAVGFQADGFNSGVSVGYQAIGYNSGVAIGYQAKGIGNSVTIGYQAGRNASGNNNVFVGYKAGDNVTTGSNNIVVGYDVEAPVTTGSNQMNIGNMIYATGVDGTTTTASSGNLSLFNSTDDATNRLQVYGTSYFDDVATFADEVRLGSSIQDAFSENGSTGDVLGNSNGDVQWRKDTVQSAVKTADQSTSSDTTLSNDTHLQVALEANTYYEFEATLVYFSSEVGDFKLDFSIPTGATGTYSFASSTGSIPATTMDGGTTTLTIDVKDTDDHIQKLTGIVYTAGTAGNITMQWAQNTSDAGSTGLRKGSLIKLTKVG